MPAAPLAGRPPFATDEPDTIYETSPSPAKRRVAPPKPDNPNKRSSAYDVYDNYLEGENGASSQNPFSSPPRKTSNSDDAPKSHLRPPRPGSGHSQTSRNSGVGGIGMGLLNMDFSDSDDDSDDDAPKPKPTTTNGSASKNAALAAAISQKPSPSSSQPQPPVSSPFSPPPTSSSPPNNSNGSLQPNGPVGNSRSPPPIAAPRPGYAAPIAALQNPFEPSVSPPGPSGPPGPEGNRPPRGPPPPNGPGPNPLNRMPSARIPPPQPIGVPPPISIPPAALARGGPIPSMSPTPLQAPPTPIMPVFAVPKTEKETSIKFEGLPTPTPRKPIMRGNGEETLLPRRGEKGDDFWRRFSMIAKDEGGKKESVWLRKTRSGTNSLSRWVWVVGIVLLLAIAGSIVLGVLLTRGDSSHTEPSVLVGNTSKVAATFTTNTPTAAAAAGTVSGSRTVLHVSPTHTIDARDVVDGIAKRNVAEAAGTTGVPVPTGFVHLRRNARKWA